MTEYLDKGPRRRITRRKLLKTAVLAATGLAVQGIKSVEADSPTPTSTPTVPPNPVATQIAKIQAEMTVKAQEIEDRKRLKQIGEAATAQAKQLEDLRNSPTAVTTSTATPTPSQTATPTTSPTGTPTPDLAATRTVIDKAVVKELADRKGSATAEVENQTATVVAKTPTVTSTPTATPERDRGEGFSMQNRGEDIRITVPKPSEIPVGIAAAGGAALLAGGAVVAAKKFPGFRALINTGLGAISKGRLKI